MKRKPSRKEIEAALAPALALAIEKLDMEQDATTLCRTMRALLGLMFSLAEAGACPPGTVVQQIHHVARVRMPRLKQGRAVLVMKEAKA